MKKYLLLALCLVVSSALAGHHEKSETSENILAAKAGYDAFNKGDIEAWKKTQAEDVTFKILEGLPYSGTHVGQQTVIDNVFSVIEEYWDGFQVTPIAFYEAGDTVFIHVKMTAEGLDTESLHMATIKDGLFVNFQAFENSALMLEASKIKN